MRIPIFLTSLFLILSSSAYTQKTKELSSSEILQGIKKLNTVGSVLYLAAHPDDENTRLIAYLTNELNLRTGYLALTRGDGGQNLIGTEQGDALGLLRTQELLAARRVDGAEQYFTRANDFGFSKNPEETFSIWNKDTILADVVWTIRRFQPDVIICRFPTTGEGGHGHHTASAILAMEAFDAAADPKRFPEQLKHVQPWRTKRMFWNTYSFGDNNTTSPDQMKLDVGTFNPLLGKSYGEIASASRTMHKSQGFGVPMQRGEEIEYFKFLKGDQKDATSLFEHINLTWSRFSETKDLNLLLQKCISDYDLQHPEKSISQLINVYQRLKGLKTDNGNLKTWRNYKMEACKNLILQCSGLWMEAYPKNYYAVPGTNVDVSAQIILRNPVNVTLQSITFINGEKKIINEQLSQNKLENYENIDVLADSTPYSTPYWLVEPHNIDRYTVKNQLLVGKPENDPAASVVFHLLINDVPFDVKRGLVYKHTDPVKGEIYRPFEVLPAVTVNISSNVWVFGSLAPQKIEFTVKANKDDVKGTLRVALPQGWEINLVNANFSLEKKGDEVRIIGELYPDKLSQDGHLKAAVYIDGKPYTKSITRIEYEHIPFQFFLSDADAKLVHIDLQKGGLNIGYIAGAGDKVAACLSQIGYHVTPLTDEDLERMELSTFDAIIAGIRAYNVNKRLPQYYDKLMKYIENGGNYIVQYNTNNRISKLDMPIGPYPFTVTTDRVTDETAEVKFIDHNAKVLNEPNKITSDDFKNWIQERGIYFANDLDKRYQTVLSMHDAKESAKEGSLIIGNYGKGHFVYTGLVFFRELPAGVPGAYRLFANILGL